MPERIHASGRAAERRDFRRALQDKDMSTGRKAEGRCTTSRTQAKQLDGARDAAIFLQQLNVHASRPSGTGILLAHFIPTDEQGDLGDAQLVVDAGDSCR